MAKPSKTILMIAVLSMILAGALVKILSSPPLKISNHQATAESSELPTRRGRSKPQNVAPEPEVPAVNESWLLRVTVLSSAPPEAILSLLVDRGDTAVALDRFGATYVCEIDGTSIDSRIEIIDPGGTIIGAAEKEQLIKTAGISGGVLEWTLEDERDFSDCVYCDFDCGKFHPVILFDGCEFKAEEAPPRPLRVAGWISAERVALGKVSDAELAGSARPLLICQFQGMGEAAGEIFDRTAKIRFGAPCRCTLDITDSNGDSISSAFEVELVDEEGKSLQMYPEENGEWTVSAQPGLYRLSVRRYSGSGLRDQELTTSGMVNVAGTELRDSFALVKGAGHQIEISFDESACPRGVVLSNHRGEQVLPAVLEAGSAVFRGVSAGKVIVYAYGKSKFFEGMQIDVVGPGSWAFRPTPPKGLVAVLSERFTQPVGEDFGALKPGDEIVGMGDKRFGSGYSTKEFIAECAALQAYPTKEIVIALKREGNESVLKVRVKLADSDRRVELRPTW